MHELSIALSILDWVALEALRRRAREVKEIELEVGRLAGCGYFDTCLLDAGGTTLFTV